MRYQALFLTALLGVVLLSATSCFETCDCELGEPQVVVTVGQEGASIDGPNGMTLTIPPGALAEGEEITLTAKTITIPDVPQAASVYEFKPLNLAFLEPVEISIPYNDDTQLTSKIVLIKADDPAGDWDIHLGSLVDTSRKFVMGSITNFGYYSVAEYTGWDTDERDVSGDSEVISDSCDGADVDCHGECWDCAVMSTACEQVVGNCNNNADCVELSDCLAIYCDGLAAEEFQSCRATCEDTYPDGGFLLDEYVRCIYCTACPISCAGDAADVCGGQGWTDTSSTDGDADGDTDANGGECSDASMDCISCVSCVEDAQCRDAVDDCNMNAECQAIQACVVSDCSTQMGPGFSACADSCRAQSPGGEGIVEHMALVDCSICGECNSMCTDMFGGVCGGTMDGDADMDTDYDTDVGWDTDYDTGAGDSCDGPITNCFFECQPCVMGGSACMMESDACALNAECGAISSCVILDCDGLTGTEWADCEDACETLDPAGDNPEYLNLQYCTLCVGCPQSCMDYADTLGVCVGK